LEEILDNLNNTSTIKLSESIGSSVPLTLTLSEHIKTTPHASSYIHVRKMIF
jgi:hypothetical protein